MKFRPIKSTILRLIVVCICGSAHLAHAQETVHSITKVLHEEPWYVEQLQLWKRKTDKNSKDADAWYNYYYAARSLRNISESTELVQKYNSLCQEIADKAYKLLPNSFEANHLQFIQSGNNPDYVKYLDKAYSINPNDPRIYDEMMIQAHLRRDDVAMEKFCKLIYQNNDIAPGILNWGYNILSELDENAVLFTQGDNDTYAAWIAQQVFHFRRDVKVVNLYLFTLDDFRKKLLAELGITESIRSVHQASSEEEYHSLLREMHEQLVKNKVNIPIYFSSTVSPETVKQWENNLYLTGLAYRFSEQSIDNISVIKRNFEKRYLLDYLQVDFAFSDQQEVANSLQYTYVAGLIKLVQHYRLTEEYAKAKEAIAALERIGKRVSREAEIQSLLKQISE